VIRRGVLALGCAFFAFCLPAVLMGARPASATVIDLTYTNLMNLPEGSITFGTVDTDSGSSLTWTLDSFTNGGITYTPVGFKSECWDNAVPPKKGPACDGFGKFTENVSQIGFGNPVVITTTDTAGGYAGHIKWTSSNGGSCTGFIGSFPGEHGQYANGGDSANGCAALTATPEPGTLVLALTGLLGVVAQRRRRGAPAD
jgi:hypothetical protein